MMAVAMWAEAGSAAAQTLDQALALAYQNNPTLLGQLAELRVTDEGVSQALAGMAFGVDG